METTQKPRQQAPQRRTPPEAGKTERARPEGSENSRRPDRPAAQKREQPAMTKKQPPAQQERRRAPAGKRSTAGEETEQKKRPPQQQAPAQRKAPAQQKRPAQKKPARKDGGKRRPEEDISTKKRAYGNSKPKKKSAVVSLMESIERSAKKSAQKRKKSGKKRPSQPTPAVIYTQPAVFNRNRLIVQLVTVTSVVLALVIGLSVFFKVEHIYVSGAEVYSESSITEVCGISPGDNLLTFSHARAAALIQANRPYVREVRFGIKLPDTVNIIIEEDDVVYAILDETGQYWLMNSEGRVVEQTRKGSHTEIKGVRLESPVPNERGVALENAPAAQEATEDAGAREETQAESIPVTTTAAQRLEAVLQILKALEDNDIVGSAASVDVSRIDDIILWYGSRYQVSLGDNSNLAHKVACMNAVINQMSEYESGILDCSFTIWPNQVGYTPFS